MFRWRWTRTAGLKPTSEPVRCLWPQQRHHEGDPQCNLTMSTGCRRSRRKRRRCPSAHHRRHHPWCRKHWRHQTEGPCNLRHPSTRAIVSDCFGDGSFTLSRPSSSSPHNCGYPRIGSSVETHASHDQLEDRLTVQKKEESSSALRVHWAP